MEIEKIIFPASDWVPNNQRLPLLIYRKVLAEGAVSASFEAAFTKNRWT